MAIEQNTPFYGDNLPILRKRIVDDDQPELAVQLEPRVWGAVRQECGSRVL